MRFPTPSILLFRPVIPLSALCVWLVFLASCVGPSLGASEDSLDPITPISISIIADGESRQLTSAAPTVGDVLAEAGIILGSFDEVDPPSMTSINRSDGDNPLVITVVRVTETLEVIPESLPFGRRIVRSSEMSPDDPPRILQIGRTGLQEVSYRIVFRDGLEVERWPTAVAIIDPPMDEIIMIGIESEEQTMSIPGRLAYINGGRAILLAGSTDSPRQLAIDGQLDGRVFQLSPGGNYLLYTVSKSGGAELSEFRNELWVIPTAEFDNSGRPQIKVSENAMIGLITAQHAA